MRHRIKEPMSLLSFINQIRLIPNSNVYKDAQAIKDGHLRIDKKKITDPNYILDPGDKPVLIEYIHSVTLTSSRDTNASSS